MAEVDPYSGTVAIIVSLTCTVLAVVLSVWHMAMHLKNYTEPTYQRYIVRIIFMVPVYATMSFGALAFSQYAMYFNTIRDVYEAWVIYNFLSLCLSWVGGPGAVVTSLSGRLLKPSCLLMTCFLPPIPLDGRFIRKCKQGCLQFVFLKPMLATTCLVLYSRGLYQDGNFSLMDSYLYITCVYMASYTVAIYALILFYVACKDLLHSFNPIPKFLMIKAVVFLTYWQGVLIFTVGELGWVKGGAADAADLQNVLICVEMFLGALGFMYAFPYKPFMHANVGANTTGISSDGTGEHSVLTTSIKHAIDLHDVVSDTVHQFAPTYHDYVLYSDGTQDGPTHYRTRTFVPLGRETGMLHCTSSSGKGSELTAINSFTAAEVDSDNLSTRTSSMVSDPTRTGPAEVQAKEENEEEDESEEARLRPSGMESSSSTVNVGGSSVVVRLPPPPEGSRSRPTSVGFDSGKDGERLSTGSLGFDGQRRSSVSTDGDSVPSSKRSSNADPATIESLALKKSLRTHPGGAKEGHGLLMDEDELHNSDPSRDDLEGYVQR